MTDRSSRKEPLWPLLMALGLVGGAVALAPLVTGETSDEPVRALEEGGEDASAEEIPTPWDRVRVEVLNAGGTSGAAAAARDRLRDEGFDVVYYGNASSFGREASEVLVRTDEEAAGRALGQALGVDEVRLEPDTTLLVDVTVLLGTDWGTGEESGAADDGADESSWWDPRRYLGSPDG